MSDGVCSFLSLLLVYLKSRQIVSAGSPEVKPAEAHASCSLCYAPRSSCDLWPLVIPPSLVHLSCHCHQLSCGFPAEAAPRCPSSFWFNSLRAPAALHHSKEERSPLFFFFFWKNFKEFPPHAHLGMHGPKSEKKSSLQCLILAAAQTALKLQNSCGGRETCVIWHILGPIPLFFLTG